MLKKQRTGVNWQFSEGTSSTRQCWWEGCGCASSCSTMLLPVKKNQERREETLGIASNSMVKPWRSQQFLELTHVTSSCFMITCCHMQHCEVFFLALLLRGAVSHWSGEWEIQESKQWSPTRTVLGHRLFNLFINDCNWVQAAKLPSLQMTPNYLGWWEPKLLTWVQNDFAKLSAYSAVWQMRLNVIVKWCSLRQKVLILNIC